MTLVHFYTTRYHGTAICNSRAELEYNILRELDGDAEDLEDLIVEELAHANQADCLIHLVKM